MSQSQAHVNTEAFRKKIEPESDFTIVTQNNLSDEYDKSDKNGTHAGAGSPDKGVEQVPVVLAVRGPISLRRSGIHTTGFWSSRSYRVAISKTGVV
tara:strand:+ start:552 stop:839 length:288 start_codon:yes stop_codon:yes gene_type:complete